MKESDFVSKSLLTRRAVSTLPPPSFSDRKRCHLSMNLHPPPNPHPFLAAGLAGASGNDHAAAKLSRQTRMRCAALMASHPCHATPSPEPFLSPGAGVSLALTGGILGSRWPIKPARCSSSWTDAPRRPQESGVFAQSSRMGLRFCSGRFCYV